MHSVPKWKREISIYQAKIWIKYLSQSKWKGHSICKKKITFWIWHSDSKCIFQILKLSKLKTVAHVRCFKLCWNSDSPAMARDLELFQKTFPHFLLKVCIKYYKKTFLATFDSVSQVEESDTCQVFQFFSTEALKFRFSSGGEESQTFL